MKNTFPAFIFALTIIFAAAKLLGNFDYSWWWVFSPLWVPLAIMAGLSFIAWLIVIFVGVAAMIAEDKG